jgi:hypothetical protein
MAATRAAMFQGPYAPQPQYNPSNFPSSAQGNLHGGSEGYRPDLSNMSRNPSQPEYRPNDPMMNFNIDDFDIDDIDLNDIPLHVEDTWQAGNSSGGRIPSNTNQNFNQNFVANQISFQNQSFEFPPFNKATHKEVRWARVGSE